MCIRDRRMYRLRSTTEEVEDVKESFGAPTTMTRWFRGHRGWTALLAFGFLFLVAFFVFRTLFAAGTVQEVQYVTQPAENGTLIVSVSGTGNAALGSSYDVTPAASGVVRELNVTVGDTVTEGQVLFTLENEQLDMSIISAQASYDQA